MKQSCVFAGLIILGFWVHGQVDSSDVVIQPDSSTRSVPSWFVDSSNIKSPPFYVKSWEYLEEEWIPELYEEDERLKLLIKIPWREDVVVPYFPKGLLPAETPPPYEPEVAWQRSAILPGLGQIYNGASWKVPIFWAGYGAAAWWINFNQSQYQRFGRAFLWAVDNDPNTSDLELSQRYDSQGLRNARNEYRQARDNGILILLGWHGLQIIEAYVDAHLNDFDVSEDLSLQWKPIVDGDGFGLSLRF